MPRGARRCLDARIRGFAEFEGFCTDRFRPGTQSFKSAMFTNFITPARGRTRFYHCLPMRSLFRGAVTTPTDSSVVVDAATPANDFLPRRSIPDTIESASSDGPIRQTFVSCFLRNKRRLSHREVQTFSIISRPKTFTSQAFMTSTIKDVAALAASRSPPSRARSTPRIPSPATLQTIRTAIDTLQFRPALAGQLRGERALSASSCRRCPNPCSPTACKASTNSRPRPASS